MGGTSGIGGGTVGPWYRVLAVAPHSGGQSSAEEDYVAILPAALHAARSRRSFIAGWLSRGAGAPLELITNAGPLPPPAPGTPPPAGPVELLFPAGARGVAMPGDWLADLDRLVWAPCPARLALPLAAAPGPGQGSGRHSSRDPWAQGRPARRDGAQSLFESTLVSLMSRPFGWLVVAEPADLIEAEITGLRTQLNVLRRYEEERARLDTERAERRLAELDAFREAGLWNVRVLAGAATEEELSLLAPVLVGSAGLSGHPYRLRTGEGAHELADALVIKLADASDGAQIPFAATAGALAALTGLPGCEVPGVRLLEPGSFDLTSEATPGPSIDIGAILDAQDRPVGTYRVPLATLNRHTFVAGATGAGKSQTVRHMLEQLTRAGIPWLAIEPVKSEYAAMAGRIGPAGQVTVVNPSDPSSVPLSVNPLAPEPGYPVQAHIDMVRALFLAAFAADEPFPQIMSQALQRVYTDCGWDAVTGAGVPGARAGPVVPTLEQLQQAALDVIDDVGYGRELQADVRGFVDVRLRSLRIGSAGRFFEGGHPADIGKLLRRNVVLAIEDVANDEDKAFLIGTLIIRIVEHLRLRARRDAAGGDEQAGPGPAGGLRHIIVIEEAHRLLRASREGASAHAVELFASMLAEIRAYGVGIVIAEQIPAKLVPDVVKNTALKILHRLPARDDRDVVGAAMNLDPEQSRQVVSLQPGMAAVFADGMDRPVRIRVPAGEHRERLSASRAAGTLATGRRSAACGPECLTGRACTLLELRTADLMAASHDDAWIRVWTEALVLAHLTNRPIPLVPAALRLRWSELDPRLRECTLATVIERALAGRALTVRACYDPARLAAVVTGTARGMLGAGKGAGRRAGPEWVIPQVRWLHELDRVCPLGRDQPDVFAPAPPLEYALAGVPDRPDMRIGQRISGLRRSPYSMELARNRMPAWTVLLGGDDQAGFATDLASVVIGVSHRGQLRQAAGEMGIAGWLEAVLSWPRRFIAAPM